MLNINRKGIVVADELHAEGTVFMNFRRFGLFLLGLIACSLISPPPAHAYLDPGTGSVIVQAVVGGIVGAAAIVKLYWTRIMQFIRREKPT